MRPFTLRCDRRKSNPIVTPIPNEIDHRGGGSVGAEVEMNNGGRVSYLFIDARLLGGDGISVHSWITK
jgi:hypothetical protein